MYRRQTFKSQLPISIYSISHWHNQYFVSSPFLHATFYNHKHSELQKDLFCKTGVWISYCSSTSLLHSSENIWLSCCFLSGYSVPKLPIFPLWDVAYFISVKGIYDFQTPRFWSVLYFARILVDFIIMACLKWKDGLNNYLSSLLFFNFLHHYCFFVTRLPDFMDFFQLFSPHPL